MKKTLAPHAQILIFYLLLIKMEKLLENALFFVPKEQLEIILLENVKIVTLSVVHAFNLIMFHNV